MPTMHLFTDDWYHGFLNSVCSRWAENDDLSADAFVQGEAILYGSAMIAQAIDNAFRASDRGSPHPTVVDAINARPDSIDLTIDISKQLKDTVEELKRILSGTEASQRRE